ncbi:MAG: response regulator [Candidatus Obscuribacterales bacterium]|nr:response regulator [Steroidobacteraceae bacterium]
MKRILAVDDSPSMRDLVALTLRQAGFEVTQAKDGDEALALATASEYDLVLADVNMPNMNGIDLIKALRGDERYRLVPILMLTTESSQDRRREGKAAGATGWIIKPFEPQQLVDTLHRVLR